MSPALSSISSKRSFPLTHAQESLNFLQQLTRGEPVYNMPQAFRLLGSLNMTALERALRDLFARHEALRTTIVDTSEGPRQTAHAESDLCFRLQTVRTEEIASTIQRIIREPFDLVNGPVFRADLLHVNEREHLLVLNLHHIFGDMSSLGNVFHELSQLYSALTGGTPARHPADIIQLGDYAAERRAKPVSKETLGFWREHLKDVPAQLDLPLDRFRPKYPSFRGEAYYFKTSGELHARLTDFARKNRSSVYMVCLAALQALLQRYTGQQRFAIATPFTDRDDPRLEHTIGYLINLLPIACDVRPETSFRELLAQVRRECLDVYSHHEISFRRILQELGVLSDSPKPPLAQVVFQYFPEVARLQLAGLVCEPVRIHSRTSKFDLCFSMAQENGTITTEVEYDTDIFEKSSIERIARHFQNLLAAIVTSPDEPIGEIQFIDREERRKLLEWSGTKADFPCDKSVHSLFEEQAAITPEGIALRTQDGEMTYRALDRRANLIAHQIRGVGVKPGDLVGVCLERSPDLIAALIGILKAGAAFVPFDANYPKSRLDYLFEDSGVRVLVTNAKLAHVAADKATILLDGNEGCDAPPASTVNPDSVAYVMYTSGSTGNPKGAMIPHRAIVRLVKGNDFASIDRGEVFLAFAPVSFDASTLEIWGALLNGATLAIYPPQFESVEQFAETLNKYNVTTLWLTAGLFNTIVDRNVQALKEVRQLLVGGDVLSVAHIQKALAALPNTQIINGYGPTENTTFTCCYQIPRDLAADRPVPIGCPIKNTTVYILDERMQPVPIGVPGDLYTGGEGLSLGYWRKPELTAASFVSNPFASGERLYKTGDRARFLDDGNIEFLGRRDAQVKIRGFRIEIEEVEAAFRKLPAVRDVAVTVHTDSAGGKNLIAYVVVNAGEASSPQNLQNAIGALLPTYACPSRIVLLPELPLGPNGKVNRAALPAPARLPSADEAEFAAPGTEIEKKLIQLWRQILEVPALSIDDNFFHMGGESLRATRAISQMNSVFNCRLTLPRLFEAPTIRQMARLVENARHEPPMPSIKSRAPHTDRKPSNLQHLSEQDIDSLLAELITADDSVRK